MLIQALGLALSNVFVLTLRNKLCDALEPVLGVALGGARESTFEHTDALGNIMHRYSNLAMHLAMYLALHLYFYLAQNNIRLATHGMTH